MTSILTSILDKLYETNNITTYKIHTDKCTFISTITANSMTNSFYLHLGGLETKGCVILYINDYKSSDTAILDTIKYDLKCNIAQDLEEGIGTKHMIFTALNILMYYFPNLKYVKLLDTSHKNCSKVNKLGATPSMNLAVYYMLFYKKTWYENLLGAYPIEPANLIKYNNFVDKLDSIEITMPFLKFINTYFKDNDLKYVIDLNKHYNLELDKLYNNSKTYFEFLLSVKTKINDKEEICKFFGIFLYTFMNDISNGIIANILGNYWIFSTSHIYKIKFKEEPFIESESLTGGADNLAELL